MRLDCTGLRRLCRALEAVDRNADLDSDIVTEGGEVRALVYLHRRPTPDEHHAINIGAELCGLDGVRIQTRAAVEVEP